MEYLFIWGWYCRRILFCVGLSFECWIWNIDNRIWIIIFDTYFTVLIVFNIYIWFFTMVASSNSRSLISSVTIWKVGTNNYKRKDLPTQRWCNYCSESRNRSTREKVRSCFRPWVIKDDSKPHKKTHHYFIQDHFNNVLQPSSKKSKQYIRQYLLAILYKIAMIILC